MNCPPEHTAGWPSTKRCHCASCHRNFSVVTHFDKHRKDGECISPETIGLAQDSNGIWKSPGEREFIAKASS